MADFSHVSFHNLARIGDYVYVNNFVTNDIFVLDKDTFEVVNVIDLNLEHYVSDWFPQYFLHILSYKKRIHVLPYFLNDSIFVYDVLTKQLIRKELGKLYKSTGVVTPYAYTYNNGKCILPPYYVTDPFWMYDCDDISIEPIDIIPTTNKYNCKSFIMPHEVLSYDDELWLRLADSNILLGVNTTKRSILEYCLPDINDLNFNYCVDDNYIWYTISGKSVLCQLSKKDETLNKIMLPVNIDNWRLVSTKDFILLLSNDQQYIKTAYVFDKKKHILISMESNMPEKLERIQDFRVFGFWNYLGYDVSENRVITYPEGGNMMLNIDLEEKSVSGKEIIFDCSKWSPYVSKTLKKCIMRDNVVHEQKDISLKDFFSGENVQLAFGKEPSFREDGGLCGEIIYKKFL